jgi:8-oxo-dGTP pyrophosphatase MutT (NUDIX family)
MTSIPTRTQVSAGGVAYRLLDGAVQVALILVGEAQRWQLPKGLVDEGETSETAALREVREEAGVRTELIAPLERIDYWYNARWNGQPVRFHKFVDFYLLRYLSGDPNDHDHEVVEARWVPVEQALEMLTFDSEKAVVSKAREMIDANREKSSS